MNPKIFTFKSLTNRTVEEKPLNRSSIHVPISNAMKMGLHINTSYTNGELIHRMNKGILMRASLHSESVKLKSSICKSAHAKEIDRERN